MKKYGFTLAEVLITLGIIGVVAAMTIPTLISDYQKRTYVTGLQRAYAQIQQVFKLAMAQDAVDLLQNTELIQSINGTNTTDNNDQNAFISKLGEYIKIQKACNSMDFSNGCHDIQYTDLSDTNTDPFNRGGDIQIFTSDGMIYYFTEMDKTAYFRNQADCDRIKADGGSMCSDIGTISIDVNGSKGPNKQGRDLFRLDVDAYGKVYLFGATAAYGKSRNWENEGNCSGTDFDYGFNCAGRIYEEGWKMDY